MEVCAGARAQSSGSVGGDAGAGPETRKGGVANGCDEELLHQLARRLEREEGQALVEYALILGLISVVAIALLSAIGTDITNILSKVSTALASAV